MKPGLKNPTWLLLPGMLILAAGCQPHTKSFTHIGNGRAIPSESIRKYADENELTFQEASRHFAREGQDAKLETSPEGSR